MNFKVVGTDPDSNTTLTYTTDNLPTLATVDSATGQFTWTPNPGQLGDYHINFTVSDGELTASSQALIKVALAPSTPTVNLDLTPSLSATPGQQVIVQTQATGLADITNMTATVDGKPVTIDNLGRFNFTPTTPGKVVVSATATDADGRVGNSSTVIKVRDPLDHTAPVVQFAPGLDGDKLTDVTKIVGTVNDSNLDSWVLEESVLGSSNWSTLATGNQSTDGVLAQFDPTQLINGFYQLRLTATSIGGHTSSTQIEVEADSVTKVGDYHRSETDFSLNLGGANFNLVRSYDSLNQNTQGAFGYGWELNTQSQIQTNVQTTGNEQFGVYNSLRVGTRLYLNLPTGERVGFTFTELQHTINGLSYYTPAWVADNGVNYTLQSVDAKLTKSGSGFYDLVTGDAYNPDSGHFTGSEYTLTAADGTVYNLSTKSGITDEIDSKSVHLYFSDSGITSSTGDTVRFVKDSQGRLTQITAPDGSLEVYGYDSQGNLISARNLGSGQASRYGYSDSHSLTLVTGTPGTSGDAVTYSTTPQISPVIADLGSASTFSTNTTTGNLISGGTDRYIFSLRDSELHSTASSQVLVEVEVDGSGLNVPVIDGLTPLATHVDANSADALYAISREGLNLIEVDSTSPTAYSLHVSIAGDVNHDGLVDGKDAQLLAQAQANGSYNSVYDFNHDGVIDATDVQILGSNYGFTANRAPVVSPTSVLTHMDLSTIVGLDKLATDPEGDSIFYRVVNSIDGTVTLTPDGHSALFKPIAGYSGEAGFDIVADDGFSSSAPTHVTVNVSNAALENLDFEGRNPKLSDGGGTDLVVYGDFADQSHVLLSSDYLQFESDNTAVASVSSTGHITGLTDGVSVLSASSHGITAVTALRVGELLTATTDEQLNISLAETQGLDVYPHAVTLTKDITRKILVGISGVQDSPDLRTTSSTHYFVSNPNILSVSADGVITTLNYGQSNVTVVYGASEAVIPVRVEAPHMGATTLGTDGGVVEASDGSTIMLAAGALNSDTTVNITSLAAQDLALPLPSGFNFAGGFQLDLGDQSLNKPAQFAMKAPAGLAAGTSVYFMRLGSMPDATGTWKPMWLLEESGAVTSDGMIRTQSPPFNGITRPGEYAVLYSGQAGNVNLVKGKINISYDFPAAFYGLVVPAPPNIGDVVQTGFGIVLSSFGNNKNQLTSQINQQLESLHTPIKQIELINQYIDGAASIADFTDAISSDKNLDQNIVQDLSNLIKSFNLKSGALGQLTDPNFFVSIPAFQVSYDISDVKIVQVPTAGLPVVTDAKVQLNPDGTSSFETTLNLPASTTADSSAPPVLLSSELKFKDSSGNPFPNGEPVLFLTANNVGDNLQNLTVEFHVGSQVYACSVLTEFSHPPLDNQAIIAVEVPNTVPLGAASIIIKRQSKQQLGSDPNDSRTINYDSNEIRVNTGSNYIFAALPYSDSVAVMQGNPSSTESSKDLLVARIPVGTDDKTDRPRALAFTNDGSRAYVALESSGRIALVDPLTLQQVDTKPDTPAVDPIDLPNGAAPHSIAISSNDEYAYIADGRLGAIYVLDINPSSTTYNQVIQTIQVGPAPYGLREIAISSDGHKLFVAAPNVAFVGTNPNTKSEILVVNIDPQDRPTDPNQNTRKWNQQIGTVEADQRAEGVAATSDPLKMTFTNRQSDATGFGVLEITNADPLHFAATTHYTKLTLGDFSDYFDVNNAAAVKVTSDGKYAFVAGYNGGPFGYGAESVDGVQAGSNIGIISDPLGPNPQLVAATRPIPLGFTTDLTLSSDGKYLYASYPNGGGVYVFNVDQIINTLTHPDSYVIDELDRGVGSRFFDASQQRSATFADLNSVPIDDINPNISVAADYGIILEDRARNQFTYGVLQQSDGQGGLLDSNHGPIATGGSPRGLATAPSDWLHLTSPTQTQSNLDPTFNWKFDPGNDVTEVDLFVSTFDQGKGLLPWDKVVDLSNPEFLPNESEQQKEQLLTKSWHGYEDFNPGRILTATWKKDTNTWYLNDGTTIVAQSFNGNTTFTLPDLRRLTAGQNYHWAVEAFNSNGKSNIDFGQFKTISPVSTNPFSSVTVLTHGFTLLPNNTGVPDDFFKLADNIVSASSADNNDKGLILLYNKPTGLWVPVNSKGQELTDVTGGLNPGDTNYLSTLAHNIETNYVHQNKALVLLPEWSTGGESTQSESGFTEAAADAIFASLVELDQALGGDVGEHDASGNLVRLYDDKGDLIRTQGDIFNSPLHFIGFSRGTVVESEIIQRLGKFYPYAGGAINADGTPVLKDGKPVRDLQMTTIDPHDFAQESLKVDIPGTNLRLKDFTDFHDPKVEVWSNVTFADNYYQTVADPNGSTWTPNGRAIDGADVNVNLDGRTGFTWDDRKGGPHGNVLSWYAGTVDLGLDKVGNGYTQQARPIYNELGEKGVQDLLNPKDNPVSLTPWYSTASSEGIDNGWFYSVLGGGEDLRPTVDLSQRVSVDFDNTDNSVESGDFAIPTVFNGNFDVGSSDDPNAPVPGWSFHNEGSQLETKPQEQNLLTAPASDSQPLEQNLMAASTVALTAASFPSLPQSRLIEKSVLANTYSTFADYLASIGSTGVGDYAVEIAPGQAAVHNNMIIPADGMLRFDLFVPGLATSTVGDVVRVFLDTSSASYELNAKSIFDTDFTTNTLPTLTDLDTNYPAVDLRPLPMPNYITPGNSTPRYQDALALQAYFNRVGYGQNGFETFLVDVPDSLRNRAARIRFVVQRGAGATGTPVYLDNVFFDSAHLAVGTPTLNGQKPQENPAFANNYLVEKPQYALSYNASTKNANWVSWEVNNSWLGSINNDYRPEDFSRDITLIAPTFTNNPEDSNYNISGFSRGHLIPASDRNRNLKDYDSTFILSNILPQSQDYNGGPWNTLETNLNSYAQAGRDVYEIAGGYGSQSQILASSNPLVTAGINVPSLFWKVALVLDRPGLDANQVSDSPGGGIIDVIAVIMGNDFVPKITTYNQQTGVPSQKIAFPLGSYYDVTIPGATSSNGTTFPDKTIKFTAGDENLFRGDTIWRVPIDQIEALTGLDLLSNLPEDVQQRIKANTYFTPYAPLSVNTSVHSGDVPKTDTSSFSSNTGSSGTTQDNTFQPGGDQHNVNQSNTSQVLSTFNPTSISTLNSAAQTLWNNFIKPQIPFNINLVVKNLPQGQLAEAEITKYDDKGQAIGGDIIISPDANGVGWFIDPTPQDNSEFSQTLSNTAFRATTDSAAYGHYDLLTALLHEMGHLEGFFSGYHNFDQHVQTINGSQLFIGDNFTATLSSDGSHLDPKIYPNDLMNPTLAPGVRKLPSLIDVEVIEATEENTSTVNNTVASTAALTETLPAAGIFNGKFDTINTTDPNYGWLTRGAVALANKTAVLTEDSALNSELEQTFIIPQDAKYLQFTLDDTTLGDNSDLAPGDAFEVALLDANEKTSLVGTAVGLTRTDAFLNIQHDGDLYSSSNLIMPSSTTLHSPMTFRVDLSGIKAGTLATLYFDILGEGKHDAKVTIENVELLNDLPVPPVTNNDTATTDATKPVIINVLANDTDKHSPIDPKTLAIETNPTHGTVLVKSDGTITYTPTNAFVGTDTFTYTVADNLGTASNPATVTVAVNDVAPTIIDLPVPKKVYQQDPTNFTATATSVTDTSLNYIWDFGDGSNPVQGATVQHTFTSSGEYQTTLTVVDAYGLKDTKTVTVYVGSTAPSSGDDPTLPPDFGDFAPHITDIPVPKKVYQQQATDFTATATSFNNEPLSYTWDFGDGNSPEIGQSVSHTFASSGEYNATLTVTDDFGFSDTKTVMVYVGSTAPTDGGDQTLPDGSTFSDIFTQFDDFNPDGFNELNNLPS